MAPAGSFTQTYRVRFDEAGADGRLRPSGYLRFAQDVAWQHSEAEGYDRDWYTQRQIHWLVRSVELRLLGPVTYGTRLSVSTEVIGWRRVLARRHSRFVEQDGSGALRAEVETDWALLGAAGRPAIVPAEIVERFDPKASFPPMRVALSPPPTGAISFPMAVRDADVDPMGHLNNAAYLDLVDAAVAQVANPTPPDPTRRVYRLEYLRPAVAGGEMAVAAWPLDDGRLACVIASDGVQLCRAVVSPG